MHIMPQATQEHTLSSDRSLAAEVRQCLRGVRQLWTQVQTDAQANREADQDLVRSLRKALTEETPV